MGRMDQNILDWLLLLGRWIHITTGVTWIGSSIFFMWLDRTFVKNENSTTPGHIGDLWMVHGGGFYHVEKVQMGAVKVPEHLHWFKWESYWTWMSGIFLLSLVFFTGSGTFLLDPSVSNISFASALVLSLASVFGSWFVYDFLWESSLTKKTPVAGHLITIAWLGSMSYFLCHQLSGRAAYMMIGAMIGTWMTANVFMRIIPRQVKMVEAAKKGEAVNAEWSKNAKNRSTHNTYLTLPIIFIMLSNHFPSTYGHELNWLVLLIMCAAGASIREYFVVRLSKPGRSKLFAVIGALLILLVMAMTQQKSDPSPTPPVPPVATTPEAAPTPEPEPTSAPAPKASAFGPTSPGTTAIGIKGTVTFEGPLPEKRKLTLPQGCAKPGQMAYADDVLVQNGKLQNVLVRVVRGHESLPTGAEPTQPLEVNQKGCLYSPRIAIARVNQDVVFVNSDPVFHNVRSISKDNTNFNLAMPMKDQRITKRFSKPEIFLETKCSVHPWMDAHIAVSDHPFIALTDKNGNFEIKGLPAGHYELEFWHEVFGTQKQDVIVGDATAPLTVVFKSATKN